MKSNFYNLFFFAVVGFGNFITEKTLLNIEMIKIFQQENELIFKIDLSSVTRI